VGVFPTFFYYFNIFSLPLKASYCLFLSSSCFFLNFLAYIPSNAGLTNTANPIANRMNIGQNNATNPNRIMYAMINEPCSSILQKYPIKKEPSRKIKIVPASQAPSIKYIPSIGLNVSIKLLIIIRKYKVKPLYHPSASVIDQVSHSPKSSTLLIISSLFHQFINIIQESLAFLFLGTYLLHNLANIK